ncbi:MAG: AEC family transporter [Xanthomonadales bacterium]|nr:AEC family transporter [Xanthomonadales bacterium]
MRFEALIGASAIVSALGPVLALIALGFCLHQFRFLPPSAWAGIEKLTYFILFPALLVHSLAQQDLDGVPWVDMLIILLVCLCSAAALLVTWYRVRGWVNGATFTSIFQGGVRFNTYIALAVSQAFYGAEGLALGAVVAGFFSLIANVLSVAAFAVWGRLRGSGWLSVLRAVALNPLIIACTLGWTLSLSGLGLPGVTADVIEIVGRASLPLGLLAVGAALRLSSVGGHLGPIGLSSLVQFLWRPALGAALSSMLGLAPLAAAVVLLALMAPTAPSGYILARQLGGDTETMASIITAQTLMAFAVMPVWVALLLN